MVFEKALEKIITDIKFEFGPNWRQIIGNKNYVYYDNFNSFINTKIENLIKDLKTYIKGKNELINSSGEIYILEEL